MKKLLFLGLGSALVFTMGGIGTASADAGPHVTTVVGAGQTALVSVAGGGRCASCHRAHTAKAVNLLKDAQPALCYTCHGGSGAGVDVVDGIDNDTGGALRGGGFEYALINGAAATKTIGAVPVPDPVTGVTPRQAHSASAPAGSVEAPVTSRHQIDGTTTGTIWGNGAVSATVNPGKAGVTLECASCHDPHGNGNYRILKPIPNDAATSAVAAKAAVPAVYAADGTTVITPAVPAVAAVTAVVVAPVNIPDALTKVYTTTDYWLVGDANVPLITGGALPAAGTPDGYIANVAAWCTTCHTRYLAPSGSAGVNSGDALFTYKHRSESGKANSPNCIQCHVSHGTSATMTSRAASFTAPDGSLPTPAGLPATFTDKAGAAQSIGGTAVGTSRLLRVDNRGTCVMCHNV
jgi:predicted CXXCH cytochrome family protein